MYTFLLIVITCCYLAMAQQLLDIRLVGGLTNSSGRVEVLSENGEWGTVCDDFWDLQDAIVVCRQLGLGPALEAPTEATFGQGSGPIFLDDVECIGSEESLLDCNSERRHNCGHSEDAGVVCLNIDDSDQTIRLTGGQKSSEGRVEIFLNGEWGTICDDEWDLDDATVVCRQLGLNSALRFQTHAFFGEGTGPIWMTNTRCTGNEADISDCSHDRRNNCTHREDASVTCAGRATIDDIRLAGGETILEGRVEVMINGQWGTICDDLWSIEDGHVVCQELGYPAAIAVTTSASFGEGEGQIWLDDVVCTGNEASIADCMSNGFGSHNCNHNEDAGVQCLAEATYSDIRLTGGMTDSEGRVEVLLNGQWGTICDDSWDLNAANVVCRELGYPAAEFGSIPAAFGEGSGPIWLDDVRCHGNELSLTSCSHNGIGINNCGHYEDVGVKCQEEGSRQSIEGIRLAGGSTDLEGRVEIFVEGEWGTICDDDWDINDAHVVCRELGFDSALEATTEAHFGEGTGPILLDDVQCAGNEATLSNCTINELGLHNCGHSEDAGVICLSEGSPTFIENMRLVDGSSSTEGRVEVFFRGEWGTICDDKWDIDDALVVCKQLGFESALDAPTDSFFGRGTGPIWLDDVECEGDEDTISKCKSEELGSHNCLHEEDASVVCLAEIDSDKIVLTGGTTPGEGILEVSINGKWEALCDDEKWGIANSYVVCRQLGFDSALTPIDGSFSVFKSASTWRYNFQCSGEEEQLDDCSMGKYVSNYTCEAQLVAVKCLNHETVTATDGQSQTVTLLNSWVYIGGLLFLVIIILLSLVIGLAVYRQNSQRRLTNFSQQRPLPNSPPNGEEDYVRMHPSGSCIVATEEKPCVDYCALPLTKNNTYTSALGLTEHCPAMIDEEVDTTYETTIFDSSVIGSCSKDYDAVGETLS